MGNCYGMSSEPRFGSREILLRFGRSPLTLLSKNQRGEIATLLRRTQGLECPRCFSVKSILLAPSMHEACFHRHVILLNILTPSFRRATRWGGFVVTGSFDRSYMCKGTRPSSSSASASFEQTIDAEVRCYENWILTPSNGIL